VTDRNGNQAEDWSDGYFTIRDNSELPPAPWATPENISNTSRESLYPDSVVDSQDNVHVVWNDFTGSSAFGNIYYANWNGSSWSSPINISDTDGVDGVNPVAIVVDSSDSLHVFWNDRSVDPNNGDIYYASYNAGTWALHSNISNNPGNSRSPRAAVDSSGNIHVVWYDYSGGGGKVFYRKYNGSSWSSIEQISPSEARWVDIAVDSSDNLHVVWQAADISVDPYYDIYYRKWAGSWQTIMNLSNSSGIASVRARIAIDPADNLHVVWYDYLPRNIHYTKFDGFSWSSNTNITNSTDQSVDAKIDIDSLGYPHIVWQEYDSAAMICHTYWTGSIWSSATRVSRSSNHSPEHPAFCIDSTDRLHAFWKGYGEILYNYADIEPGSDTQVPTVVLVSPTTGEQLSIGETYEIRWNASDNVGVSSISLKYTTDGENFTNIPSGKDNDGIQTWTVPDVVSDTVQIWVTASDASDNKESDVSGYFSISDRTPPNVSLISPNGGETWIAESEYDITWSATDNVNVALIDLFYSTDGGSIWLEIAKDELNDGAYSWTVEYDLSTNCKIRVDAHDSSDRTSSDVSNGVFSITTANNPPYAPHSPVPANTISNVSMTTDLIWVGGDPDSEDTVTYDVYLGTDSNSMDLICDDQPNTSCSPSTLEPKRTYYWKVVASDGKESSENDPAWSFTTGTQDINAPSDLAAVAASKSQIDLSWKDSSNNEEGFKIERKKGPDGTYMEIEVAGPDIQAYTDTGLDGGTTYIYRVRAYYGSTNSVYSNEIGATTINNPPNTPTALSPSNVEDQPINVTLNWQGGDPDSGDTVTYDVYLGASTDPPLLSGNQPETTCDPGALGYQIQYQKFYYWKVVATDSHGASSPGPLWWFNTEVMPVPAAPDDLQVNAESGSEARAELMWADNSGNELGFKIERKQGADGVYRQVSVLGADITSFTDNYLIGRTAYCYRLRAFNSSGHSGYCPERLVITPIVWGDIVSDGVIDFDDVMAILEWRAELTDTVFTAEQLEVADVSGNGRVGAYDAGLIYQYILGLITDFPVDSGTQAAPIVVSNVGNCYLELRKALFKPGTEFSIVVNLENTGGLIGADLALDYDQAVLTPVEVSTSCSSDHFMEHGAKDGKLRISLAASKAIQDGNVVEIAFRISPEATASVSSMSLSEVILNDTTIRAGQVVSFNIAPYQFTLLQNYPNPFNPDTWIPYELAEDSEVFINIYNVFGQLVRRLDLGYCPTGVYYSRSDAAHWDGRNDAGEDVASGVYFYHISAGRNSEVSKMVILR
jgi:hypothetical protein